MNDLNLFCYLMLSKEKIKRGAGTENAPARLFNYFMYAVPEVADSFSEHLEDV